MSTFAQPINGNSSTNTSSELSPTTSSKPTSVHVEEALIKSVPEMGNSFSPHLVVQLKYIKADEAKKMFTTLMGNNQIQVEAMNNRLIVMGSEEDLETVKEILAELDKPPRQVMFEAQVIEVSLIDIQDIGIDWGPSTNLPKQIANGDFFRTQIGKSEYGVNFKAIINHLLQNKKGRLLANPRIAALDGCTAQIMIGDKLAVSSTQNVNGTPITNVTYVDVGIKLEVTPTVNDDDTITTHIRPEVSNKTDMTAGAPNIRTRQAETTLRVKKGETIVLGGLLQRQETSDEFKVPFLGDFPVIGRFFRTTTTEKSVTELVIMITPKMIDL